MIIISLLLSACSLSLFGAAELPSSFFVLMYKPEAYICNDRYYQGSADERNKIVRYASEVFSLQRDTFKFVDTELSEIRSFRLTVLQYVERMKKKSSFDADTIMPMIHFATKMLRPLTMADAISEIAQDALAYNESGGSHFIIRPSKSVVHWQQAPREVRVFCIALELRHDELFCAPIEK